MHVIGKRRVLLKRPRDVCTRGSLATCAHREHGKGQVLYNSARVLRVSGACIYIRSASRLDRARSQTTVHHIIISLNLCSLLAVTIIILNVAQPGGRFPLARCYPRIVSRTPYFLPCFLCNSVVLIARSMFIFFLFLSRIQGASLSCPSIRTSLDIAKCGSEQSASVALMTHIYTHALSLI